MFRKLFKQLKSSQYSELEQMVREATSLDTKAATAAEVERIIEQTQETAENCQLVWSVLLSRVAAPEIPHVTKGLSILLSLLDALPPHARAYFVEGVIENNDLFTRLSEIDRIPNAIVIRSGASEVLKAATAHSLTSPSSTAALATATELAPAAPAGPPPPAPTVPPPPVSARARQASLANRAQPASGSAGAGARFVSGAYDGAVVSDAVVYTADGRIASAPPAVSQSSAYQPFDLRAMSPSVSSSSPTSAAAAAAAAAAGGGVAEGAPTVAVYDHPDYALVVASGPTYTTSKGVRGRRDGSVALGGEGPVGGAPRVPPPTVGPSLASRMRGASTAGSTRGGAHEGTRGVGLEDLGAYDPCPSPVLVPIAAATAGGEDPAAAVAAAAAGEAEAGADGDEEDVLEMEEGVRVGAALALNDDGDGDATI